MAPSTRSSRTTVVAGTRAGRVLPDSPPPIPSRPRSRPQAKSVGVSKPASKAKGAGAPKKRKGKAAPRKRKTTTTTTTAKNTANDTAPRPAQVAGKGPVEARGMVRAAEKPCPRYKQVLKNWNRLSASDERCLHEEHYRERLAVRIHMPDRLKSLLVDDWENITKNLTLINLPVKMPVSVILQSYWDMAREERVEGTPEYDILEEVMSGLEEYFNKSLGRILLYRFERDQYLDVYKKTESPVDDLAGKTMAEIYGGEHLLRLFVSLPELIAQTNMDYQSVQRLREELSKITMWLAKDGISAQVFNSEYEPADQEYIEKAKGDEQR